MADIKVEVLADTEIKAIHDAAIVILRDTGVMVHHEEALSLLAGAGAHIDPNTSIARLPESLVMDSISLAAKRYVLYGRDPQKTARFGYGDFVQLSSPGQFAWIDSQSGRLRPACIADARNAIRLGDALENITIVGAMAQPAEIPVTCRDVALTAELVKGSSKPTRCWINSGRSAGYVLEIYRAAAGGDAALRKHPMTEVLLEPISPLRLPKDGLDVVAQFARAGQPVSIGPMAMTCGTAPATLAATLAQENAEILAGIVVTQLFAPGTPVTYGGIPHIMDPRTSICSFGSPEQALMAVAMTQIARYYGLPVYINVGLTDAKLLDSQAGIEKAATLLLGALAGADMFGHCGICGTDHGAALAWLLVDHELADYVKRIVRGFEVGADTLAAEVIAAVGPGGNYLAEKHTVEHFRRELWLPSPLWTRQSWDNWQSDGRRSMADRAAERARNILADHNPAPIDPTLEKEIDRIVQAARKDLNT